MSAPPAVPLVALAAAAYIAGCFAGFSSYGPATAACAALAAVACAARRQWFGAGIALAGTAGLVVAWSASRDDATCVRRLRAAPALAGSAWTAVLDAAAAPGAYTPAHLTLGRCTLRAALAVQRGSAPGGARVRVTGTATVRGGRVVVVRATVQSLAPAGILARWRAASSRAVDRVFARDRAMAQALLLADMRQIDPAVKDRFVAAGLVHALSVSGLHVGIIGAAAELVFGVILGANAARGATIALVAVYVAMIGAPPPAVRAAAMLGVVAASRAFERPTSGWAVIAVGAVLPLGDPRTVLDLGWQLSVLGVASLVIAGRINEWAFPEKRWWTPLAASATTSVVATVASAPLVAYGIGRISLVGPVANILANPLLAVAQPALFLGLALAPFPAVARVVGDAAHLPLTLFDLVARWSASVPYAAITAAPTLGAATLAGIATAALLAAAVARSPRPWVYTAVGATVLLVLPPFARPSRTELHMIDVGQGDALALRTRRNRWVLIDAGRGWKTNDAARTVILPYLRRFGGPVDALLLTHPHADHIGGAATLLEQARPAALYESGYVTSATMYRELLATVRRTGVPWRRPSPGDSLIVDEAVITFLGPERTHRADLHANDASLVTMIRIGDRRILLTGDAEVAQEAWLVGVHGARLRADVLKAGHHGSRTSTTPAFLAAVRPAAALVSVGAGNDYGHPSPETIDALAAAGAHIVRTDLVGDVVLRTDGRRLSIHADRTTWHLPGSSPP